MNIGYCCLNLSINESLSPKNHIKTTRGMRIKTFNEKGVDYVSELAILNIKDLLKVLKWNYNNDINLFRITSDLIPCMGLVDIEKLPQINVIKSLLKEAGNYIKSVNMRVSFHPSHYCVLASQNSQVVEKSIKDLNDHAMLFDWMGLDQSYQYPINIHVSSYKPTCEEAAERFIRNFHKLNESTKKRLVIENDDTLSGFSVEMLYNLIYKHIDIPITLDFHHFKYGPQDQTLDEAFILATSTWPAYIKPLFHMSSSKTIEDPNGYGQAHSNFIYEPIPKFNIDFDCDIEAKQKDKAVLKYRKDFLHIYSKKIL